MVAYSWEHTWHQGGKVRIGFHPKDREREIQAVNEVNRDTLDCWDMAQQLAFGNIPAMMFHEERLQQVKERLRILVEEAVLMTWQSSTDSYELTELLCDNIVEALMLGRHSQHEIGLWQEREDVQQPARKQACCQIDKLEQLHHEQMTILSNYYEQLLQTRSEQSSYCKNCRQPILPLQPNSDRPQAYLRFDQKIVTVEASNFSQISLDPDQPQPYNQPIPHQNNQFSCQPAQSSSTTSQATHEIHSRPLSPSGCLSTNYPILSGSLAIEFYGNKNHHQHQHEDRSAQSTTDKNLSELPHSHHFYSSANELRQQLDSMKHRMLTHQYRAEHSPTQIVPQSTQRNVQRTIGDCQRVKSSGCRVPLQLKYVDSTNAHYEGMTDKPGRIPPYQPIRSSRWPKDPKSSLSSCSRAINTAIRFDKRSTQYYYG